MWSFHQAPLEYRTLFPEGSDNDWVAHVPQSQRQRLEPLLRLWHRVYPIHSRELEDGSVAYHGAPKHAMDMVAQPSKPAAPAEIERRAALRIHIQCPSRYETHSEPKQIGSGHTIDMSSAGIAFTTQSWLPANAKITLHVSWPVKLEGDVPIELRAVGRLARTEAMMAAMQLDSMSFTIPE